MLNSFMVVGRLNNIDLKDDVCVITLSVPRSFKNKDGEYDVDNIKIQVFDSLSSKLNEYCELESLVGVKGRIQEDNLLNAEKITFLGSEKK